MPIPFARETFAAVIAELVDDHSFMLPLSLVGVSEEGSIFGVRVTDEEGHHKAAVVCQHVEIQFELPMNVMVVDDSNRVARVLLRSNGERVVTVL